MNILDTTAINYILKSDVLLNATYFITPDIEDEALAAEIALNKKMSPVIKNIINENFFNEVEYIKNYFYVLNKYGGRSFFNMTGFGDISIISLAKTLVGTIKNSQQAPLPGLEDEVIIYLSDVSLRSKIIKEVGGQVKLFAPEDISSQ